MTSEDEKPIRMMLGYLCIAKEAEASLPRKVEVLDRFEFSDAEIAAICGCGVPSVANARLRKKSRNAKTKKAKS